MNRVIKLIVPLLEWTLAVCIVAALACMSIFAIITGLQESDLVYVIVGLVLLLTSVAVANLFWNSRYESSNFDDDNDDEDDDSGNGGSKKPPPLPSGGPEGKVEIMPHGVKSQLHAAPYFAR